MNDVEIDLMKMMLEQDPYKRITARQAIEHEYFDELRCKDPEYSRPAEVAEDPEGESDNSSVEASDQNAPSGQIYN